MKPIIAPWDEIKAKYIQGVPTCELAEIYNIKPDTISQRAKRHNWITAKIEVRKAVSAHLPQALMDKGKRVREALGDIVASATDQLASMPVPQSIFGLDAHQTVVNKLVTNGEKLFGWNADQSSDVRITVLSGASESEDSHDQVIDV